MKHKAYIEETPENEELVVQALGREMRKDLKNVILLDGSAYRINGRYIAGNVPVVDENNGIIVTDDYEVVTRRQRFRIPKGHPWRGKRP